MLESTSWDMVLKGAAVVISAAVAITQFHNHQAHSRSSLKADLEILRLIDPNDPQHAVVKRSIETRIAKIYSDYRYRDWLQFSLSALAATVFGVWTIALAMPHFTGWAAVTAYLTVASIGSAFYALNGGLYSMTHRRRTEAPLSSKSQP